MVMPQNTFASSECSVAWMLGAQSLPTHIDPDRVALRWRETVRTYSGLRARALSRAPKGIAAKLKAARES